MSADMLAAATTPVAPIEPIGYWLIYGLVGILIVIVAAVLIALVPWLRKSGARDKALDELIQLLPSLKRVLAVILGDKTTYPETKSLVSEVSEMKEQLNQITSQLPPFRTARNERRDDR